MLFKKSMFNFKNMVLSLKKCLTAPVDDNLALVSALLSKILKAVESYEVIAGRDRTCLASEVRMRF